MGVWRHKSEDGRIFTPGAGAVTSSEALVAQLLYLKDQKIIGRSETSIPRNKIWMYRFRRIGKLEGCRRRVRAYLR